MINLVPKESRTPPRLKRIISIFKRTSIVVLGVYLVGFVFVAAASFFLQQQKKNLLQESQQLVADVENLKSQEKLLQVVKNRVSLASSVLSKTSTVSTKTVSDAISLVPQNIQINSLDLEGGTVSVSGKAQDIKSLSGFFVGLEKNNKFPSVFLGSLSLGTDGFNFTLTLQ